ncbi:MAG TPA: 5-oxoprolinase subunit PxpB [Umezawaea sp.]|jgi:KipI family sensor histidine kinase inhibitor|nr:5-oxoprolinase subunit PxpB [Umezawaea sp.]
MRLRRCGTDAVLVEVDSLGEVSAVRAAVRAADLPDLVELVPAARTVLISVRPGTGLSPVRRVLDQVDLSRPAEVRSREVRIPVHYDGPDLELVARTAGMSEADVVALHSGTEYEVAFCGFAPGFGYLVGLPEALRQPRLDSPRTKVPAGSVAIAGEFTAAYPRATPGGWRLLGRTDATLFDARREVPALLAPGDRVRFEVAG